MTCLLSKAVLTKVDKDGVSNCVADFMNKQHLQDFSPVWCGDICGYRGNSKSSLMLQQMHLWAAALSGHNLMLTQAVWIQLPTMDGPSQTFMRQFAAICQIVFFCFF